MENQERSAGETTEQDGREGHGKCAAPEEWIKGMDTSVRGLVDQRRTAETPPSQLPEGSPSFITFYKVSGENTGLHLFPILSIVYFDY